MTLDKRITDLEHKAGADAPRVVVNWDPEPGPVEPGTVIVEWDEGCNAAGHQGGKDDTRKEG